MKLNLQSFDGAANAGDIELSDDVFGLEPRADILHRVVTWQLEKRRATARPTRERSDVARTGKKFGNKRVAVPLDMVIGAHRSLSAAARRTARGCVISIPA